MSDDIGETAREEERNIQVHYEPETGKRYLIARDEFGATWGRLYLNDRGTPLKRARRKRVATLFEIAADNLSDVYRADDDPHDWGRSMGLRIAEVNIGRDGSLQHVDVVETDANAAMAPYPREAFAGFGEQVNELLADWGVI